MPSDPILIDIPTELPGERVLLRLLQDGDAQDLFEAVDESRDHLAPWMLWAKAHVQVQLLTRLAFAQLAANRVQIRMDPRNVRSERVAQRAGFLLEGTLRNASIDAADKPADRYIYALTRQSYANLPWA